MEIPNSAKCKLSLSRRQNVPVPEGANDTLSPKTRFYNLFGLLH